jgi:TRAP transporter TAXI family solute receptor
MVSLGALRRFVPVLLLTIVVCGCRAESAAPARTDLVIGTVFPNGSWDLVGRALAKAYTERLPDVRAVASISDDLEFQADAVEQGHAQLAIEDVETVYLAYSTGTTSVPQPHRNLRAIAVLFSTAVQIVARRDAGITRIQDLRGKRVGIGSTGSPTVRAATLILQSHGVPLRQIQPVMKAGDAAAFRSGELDAAFIYAPFQNPVIAELTGSDDVRLIPIERRTLGAIQDEHHFLKSTTIPGGTYKNQDDDVLTVGMDVLLVCRQDLPNDLVYRLSRTLFEVVPALRDAHASAAGINPDRGPTTAIPLHAGAARYYREREILR